MTCVISAAPVLFDVWNHSVGPELIGIPPAYGSGRLSGRSILIVDQGRTPSRVAGFVHRLIDCGARVSILNAAEVADRQEWISNVQLSSLKFSALVRFPGETIDAEFVHWGEWTAFVPAGERFCLAANDNEVCFDLMKLFDTASRYWHDPLPLYGLRVRMDRSLRSVDLGSFLQKLQETGAQVLHEPSSTADIVITDVRHELGVATMWLPVAEPNVKPQSLRFVPEMMPADGLVALALSIESLVATPEAKWRRWLW